MCKIKKLLHLSLALLDFLLFLNIIYFCKYISKMAIKIVDDCINCGACEPECPNNAIYEPETPWRFSDGTAMEDSLEREDGGFSDEFYYIATDKCTECIGFHEEPQCAAVCPVDCCVDDEENVETEEELLKKKKNLHLE